MSSSDHPKPPSHTAPKKKKKLKRKAGENIDWSDIPLGSATDAEIGRIYGIKSQTVASARRARGIQSTDRYAAKKATHKYDWDNEPRLGAMPDRLLQRILGMASASSVSTARSRRGIPKFIRPDPDDLLLLLIDLHGLSQNPKYVQDQSVPLDHLEYLLKKHKLAPIDPKDKKRRKR